MKKLSIYLLVLCLAVSFIPARSLASVAVTTTTTGITNDAAKTKADAMILRLKAIKEMDKTNLSSSEKKVLRKEVRAIKQELAHNNGGIYLSLGAVVIIILLLIILL